MVKTLIFINVAVWFFLIVVFQQFFLGFPGIFLGLGLVPARVLEDWWIWQLGSYAFIHSQGIFHILFNMFILWMFGGELERFWGSKTFLIYYLFCAIGASLLYFTFVSIYTYFLGGDPALLTRPVIGASGAVFGLLLAYGKFFGDRLVYFMMIFPMKTRHFVIVIACIEIVSMLNHGMGGPVANLAHLGGLVSGLAFFELWKLSQKMRWFDRLKIVRNNDREDSSWH